MKGNTWIWIVIALLLGAGAYYFTNSNSGSTIEIDERDFAIKDTSAISKIFMADKQGHNVILTKAEDGFWYLPNGAKAREKSIHLLLETMALVTVKAPVGKAAYPQVIKNLSSTGVKVEIYKNGKDKPSKTYYVGGPNGQHDGTYMLLEDAKKPFLMHIEGFHGFLTPRYFVDARDWETSEVFNYRLGQIKKLEVDYPMEEHESFSIQAMEGSKYVLYSKNNQVVPRYNAQKIVQYLALYQDLNFESYEKTKSETFIDSVKKSIPFKTIRITDEADKTSEVKFYHKPMKYGAVNIDGEDIIYDEDRIYLWIDDDKFVVGQYFVFDKINAKLSSFTLNE
jgi:hypothetical protein